MTDTLTHLLVFLDERIFRGHWIGLCQLACRLDLARLERIEREVCGARGHDEDVDRCRRCGRYWG